MVGPSWRRKLSQGQEKITKKISGQLDFVLIVRSVVPATKRRPGDRPGDRPVVRPGDRTVVRLDANFLLFNYSEV